MKIGDVRLKDRSGSMNVSALILAALGVGILFGAIINTFFPAIAPILDHSLLAPIGAAFLRLIQFVVVPLVFSSLILGLTRVPSASKVGQYVLKLFTIYILTGIVAVLLGLSIETLLQPGANVAGFSATRLSTSSQNQSLITWLISLIPINPLEAMSTGNLLQTIVSGGLIGLGIQLAGTKAKPFVSLIESIYVIFEQILTVILYTAPIGVFALISSLIATQGLEVIAKLLLYVLGLTMAFTIMLGIYAVILISLSISPVAFFRAFFPTLSISFGTASSNAALPIALQNAQDNFQLRDDMASFAIPLGSALKRDGTAIFQGFNALFIAQVYHIPLTPELIGTIGMSAFLISFSTAGVPGSGVIAMTTVLTAAGLPLEGIAIVAGVDRLTDGLKTVVNVTSNIISAVILSRWEPAVLDESVVDTSVLDASILDESGSPKELDSASTLLAHRSPE